MVHPGGLLALGSPFGPLLKQRYHPWCLRLIRYLFDTFIAEDFGEYGASGRFEPPTARFVAEYSIQLSYGASGKFILLLILIPLLKPYQVEMVHPGGFEPPTARFVAEYLSS